MRNFETFSKQAQDNEVMHLESSSISQEFRGNHSPCCDLSWQKFHMRNHNKEVLTCSAFDGRLLQKKISFEVDEITSEFSEKKLN